MDFALDQDQQLIVETVRRFADRDLRAWAADADRAGAAPDRLAQVAGELGFFLDAVPADAGGLLEGPYSHQARALRGLELGRGCAALAALLEANVEPALATGAVGLGRREAGAVHLARRRRARDVRPRQPRRLTVTTEGEDIRLTGQARSRTRARRGLVRAGRDARAARARARPTGMPREAIDAERLARREVGDGRARGPPRPRRSRARARRAGRGRDRRGARVGAHVARRPRGRGRRRRDGARRAVRARSASSSASRSARSRR